MSLRILILAIGYLLVHWRPCVFMICPLNMVLGANLRYFKTCGSRLTFDSNFRIFPMVEKFILNSQYVTFESPDFMYHLPNNLVQLHLASEQGKMGVFTQMVKWPLMLTNVIFHNFNINNQTLEF